MKSPLTNEILRIIRTQAYQKDMSISEFGRQAGVSKAWLSRLKNTDANLSLETAEKLLKVAGYKLEIKKSSTQASNNQPIKEAIKEEVENEVTSNRIIKKMLEAGDS